jgi:Enoyl-(Acyl carrier protein) reductase
LQGIVSIPDSNGYGVSKAAFVHLTRTLAAEWARKGIRAPHVMEIHEGERGRIKLGRRAREEAAGGTIAFIGVRPPPTDLRLPLMVMEQQRLQGVTVGSVG